VTPFWKTTTFWISACAWFTVVGGNYAGALPSPYGLVLGNVVVLAYAALRCLTKRRAGQLWKGILLTSEFLGTLVTMLVNLLDSLRQVPSLPPRVLVALTGASGLLVVIMHQLSGGGSPAAPSALFPVPGFPTRGAGGLQDLSRLLRGSPLPEPGAPVAGSAEAVTEPVRAEDLVAVTPDLVNLNVAPKKE